MGGSLDRCRFRARGRGWSRSQGRSFAISGWLFKCELDFADKILDYGVCQ